MSILSSSKCVLLLTDDMLCMYRVNSRGAKLVESYNWKSTNFEGELAAALNKQVGDGSVYVLNDTVEQHYRKEKINKLTFFDRGSIINRRLNIAFPSYPTRAAFELKEKRKDAVASNENIFLFAAIPSTDSLRKLLEAVRRSNCTIASYCLLPIESIDLVEKLVAKVAKENRQSGRSVWSLMIGQHQGGGLRQIVVKGGQIALTRITPMIAPLPENAAQWATDAVQEVQATISYLSRFGYVQDDGLDIVLISKPDFGTLVEDMLNIPCTFNSLTLQRAAELLGISVGRGQDQAYSETLHLAWHAKKSRPLLPMKSREMNAVANPRKSAFFAMLVMTAALGYLSYNVSTEILALEAAKKNLFEVTQMKAEADKLYDSEIKRKQSLGIDVKLIQGALGIYKEYKNLDFDPLPILSVVAEELKELRIDDMKLDSPFPDTPASVSPNTTNTASIPVRHTQLVLKFVFPGTIKPEDGNYKLELLRRRIVSKVNSDPALKSYQVKVSKQLADLTYTGEVSNETGLTAEKRKATDVYTGEITIQKDIGNATSSGT